MASIVAGGEASSLQYLTMLTTLDPVTAANELRPVLLRLNRHLRRELGPIGITGGQAALLHAIRTSPGIGVRGPPPPRGGPPPPPSRPPPPPRRPRRAAPGPAGAGRPPPRP